MAYPKWMYRKHPSLGIFQKTLVLHDTAEKEIAALGWTEDPTKHGFKVRPAAQVHTSHIVPGTPLHEEVPDNEPTTVTEADIKVVTAGDKNGK